MGWKEKGTLAGQRQEEQRDVAEQELKAAPVATCVKAPSPSCGAEHEASGNLAVRRGFSGLWRKGSALSTTQ